MIWVAQSRRILPMQRQDELKRRTAPLVAGNRQPSLVSFHDRTANRESHAHAAGFGGEEGAEHAVRILAGDPDAAIRDSQKHPTLVVLARPYHQFARPIRNRL